MNRIFSGSCEELGEIKDDSVALTVTSPPYWNAIDYDVHSKNSEENFRTRKYSEGYQKYEEYLAWLTRIFRNVYKKTKPGGFAAIVIGTVLFEKKHFPVPFDLVSKFMQETDWEFHQDIVWHKVTGGVKRFGVFIQKPIPGYFYPNIMTEYILVFRKPGPSIFKDIDDEKRNNAKLEITRLYTTEIANTVWHIAPVPPNQLDHPCPFPEEIPQRLIDLYSFKGDTVLDPFAGIGTTLKVAKYMGREYVGYELIEKYIETTRKRLTEKPALREGQLIAVFEKISSSEPLGGPGRNGKGNGPRRLRPKKFKEKIEQEKLFS